MESQSGTPPTRRLVIRVKIPNGAPQAPVPRWNRTALLIAGAVAILVIWVGISIFSTEEKPTSELPAPAPASSEAVPAVSDPPRPTPVESKPIEPTVREQPEAPPTPINEVIPDVPRSARETIRGTIRVSVRVSVDQQGKVLTATADVRGPSRYFERLAVEAAKKWTFTPAASEAERVMLVSFDFTRAGTTARASPRQ